MTKRKFRRGDLVVHLATDSTLYRVEAPTYFDGRVMMCPLDHPKDPHWAITEHIRRVSPLEALAMQAVK